MNEKRRYWVILIIVGVALLLIASLTTANWYGNRKADKEQTATERVSDSLSVESNRNLDNVSAEDNINRFLSKQAEITDELVQALKKIERSGNGSLDYLKGMISLDESAVTMSESYLSHGGSDKQFKLLSEDIITDHRDEISKMKDLVNKYSLDEHKNEDKESAYLEDFSALLNEYEKGEKATSASLEHAYAEALIRHHQMAVDMARSILEYTDYNEIKSMAQNMINTREQLIDDLKKLAP
jgi:uncharacterized protein (DUF305 family)